jgi:hypothetical protein
MSDLFKAKAGSDEVELSLTDLANMDMDSVQEVHSSGGLPQGNYLFESQGGKLELLEINDAKRAVMKFTLKVLQVGALAKSKWVDVPAPNTAEFSEFSETLLGKEYTESFFINDVMQDAGRIKAFLSLTGFKGSGSLQEVCAAHAGTRFMAPIKHSKNKNDDDKWYTNIVRDKIAPVEA